LKFVEFLTVIPDCLLCNFKLLGFLVMAFDPDDDSKPIGTFKQPADGLAQLMNCTVDGVLVRRSIGNTLRIYKN
jgi:hypothetical protein